MKESENTSEYKGQMRPIEYITACDEAVSLNSKRLSPHKLILTKIIGLIFSLYHQKSLKISQIYLIMSIENFKISIYNKFEQIKLRDINTERKNIKSILDALVKEGLVHKQNQEYRNYYEILFLGNEVQLLDKSFIESSKIFKKMFPDVNGYEKYCTDEELRCFLNNIINSKTEIPICKDGIDYIVHQFESLLNIITKDAENNLIDETYDSIKNGSKENPKEIPFHIIHKVLNQHIHT